MGRSLADKIRRTMPGLQVDALLQLAAIEQLEVERDLPDQKAVPRPHCPDDSPPGRR